MLYPENKKDELDINVFKNPGKEYRGAPFFSWNCKLEREKIFKQIEIFKEMGFGGFHVHARNGLDTKYMGDEFLKFIEETKNKAKKEDMFLWLYDEDRFPSGSAGGQVTEKYEYRAKYLSLSKNKIKGLKKDRTEFYKAINAGEKPKGYYLASYRVEFENGYLSNYKRIENKDGNDIYHAYVKVRKEEPWYNDQTYVDVMNKEAIDEFIKLTHEKYYEKVGDEFGKIIPAIFTDEPQLSPLTSVLFYTSNDNEAYMSFTDDFPETYKKEYGEDIIDNIPELLWERKDDEISKVRWKYHNHLAERFTTSYFDNIGKWCEEHNIALTGHLMSEPSLLSQTLRLAEAMRHYRSFQFPGIDILCNDKEFSTAKQAVSVARQYGREAVISELYGVTHWYHDFKGHKLQGDWQAVLGVTVRVPHLALLSMKGEAKRDWPASINYQSPWYKEYSYIEDHFARLNTVLTRGKADVKVAVIHPIESYWLKWGANEQTGLQRDEMDRNFEDIISWLLYGTIDFDFLSESLLTEISDEKPGYPFKAGEMSYKTIIVPNCITLRETTVERLEDFISSGGRVLITGQKPKYIDTYKNKRINNLIEKSEMCQFGKASILEKLEDERDIEIRNKFGRLSDNLFYQMRKDNQCKWLYICHVNRKNNNIDKVEKYNLMIKGEYSLTKYDTINAKSYEIGADYKNGNTVLGLNLYAEDSLLLKLSPGRKKKAKIKNEKLIKLFELNKPKDYILEEPNVLLLDKAEYSFDESAFYPAKDILRIDNEFREILEYPKRDGVMKQPYAVVDNDKEHNLTLRYTVNSEIEVNNVKITVEDPQNTNIYLNDKLINKDTEGYFVDWDIKTITIGKIKKGINTIVLKMKFKRKTEVEYNYLLGDFGVEVYADKAKICKKNDEILYGDITRQKLPFYSGNLTYVDEFVIEEKIENAVLEVPHFSAPVLSVSVDRKKIGLIALSPNRIEIGKLMPGKHEIKITSYGNRYNSFGTLHNSNDEYKWYGPASFRTTGSEWTDNYVLRENGILSKPIILEKL